jgi:hypothetical protein
MRERREEEEGRREVRAVQTAGRRYSANPWCKPTFRRDHSADPPSLASLQRTHSPISPADSSSPRHLPIALLHAVMGLAGLDMALYSEALEFRQRVGGIAGVEV